MSWSKGACLVLAVFSCFPFTSKCSERGNPELKKVLSQSRMERLHPLATRGKEIIKDFAIRQCWLLERNGTHPGWPARLVRISDDLSCRHLSVAPFRMSNPQTAVVNQSTAMIREGDALSITEETPALQSELEGIALSSGLRGDVIGVRLQFARKVVRARVMGPGRVQLATDLDEVR